MDDRELSKRLDNIEDGIRNVLGICQELVYPKMTEKGNKKKGKKEETFIIEDTNETRAKKEKQEMRKSIRNIDKKLKEPKRVEINNEE